MKLDACRYWAVLKELMMIVLVFINQQRLFVWRCWVRNLRKETILVMAVSG